MLEMKIARHAQIIKLINQYDIETQEELAKKLEESGFAVTQATISRDIRQLKLTKVPKENGGSRYAVLQNAPSEVGSRYARVLKDAFISVDLAKNILVIKTVSGMAMAAAAAFDEMNWNEIVGCIGGDDTILCVARDDDAALVAAERLKKMVRAELNASVHNILYIHEGINGALSTPNEKELPTNIFSDFDTVLVGHYHNRCIIKGTNIEYIGSSRQHNFGEDEEKGYTIIYDDGSHEFIKNQVNIRYKVLDIKASQINSKLIDKLNDMKADGRYKIKTRISCTSQEAPNIDKQKLLEAGSSKVEIVTEDVEITETTAHSLDKKFDKSGIKQEYTSFCANKGIINIEMGLQYLDKIS